MDEKDSGDECRRRGAEELMGLVWSLPHLWSLELANVERVHETPVLSTPGVRPLDSVVRLRVLETEDSGTVRPGVPALVAVTPNLEELDFLTNHLTQFPRLLAPAPNLHTIQIGCPLEGNSPKLLGPIFSDVSSSATSTSISHSSSPSDVPPPSSRPTSTSPPSSPPSPPSKPSSSISSDPPPPSNASAVVGSR